MNDIIEAAAAVDPTELAAALVQEHVADIVERLNAEPLERASAVLSAMPLERAAEVLDEPGLEAAADLVEAQPPGQPSSAPTQGPVNPAMVRMMARGHVYADPNWLTGERFTQKMAVVTGAGARHAAIRFVTGMLDPMPNHSLFIETAKRVKEPILVVYGAATPRRSKAEMETLASVPHVQSVELSHGKLAVHEEFPDAVAEAVRSFLRRDSGGQSPH
jgi:pimeloyl-ACP methyl ester carboxylesterase